MKIIIVGAAGTIGRAIAAALSADHEIVRVGRTSGDHQADIASKESIKGLFDKVGRFDALVSAAGAARFAPFDKLSDDDYAFSIANKLMGQVNLVRVGMDYIQDGGSFTLTSGILASRPMIGSGAISLVNAGLEGFARAAALEAPRGVRVNVVSPPWVSETLVKMGRDGSGGMPAAQVAKAYLESVLGRKTGQVFAAQDFE